MSARRARAGRPAAVVGIADHGGWAVCVTVAASGRLPAIVDRRRVELVEPGVPGQPYPHDTVGMPVVVDRRRVELVEPGVPSQPYHHDTVGMPRAEAEALVAAVRQSVMRSAAAGLAALCDDLRPYEIAAVTLRIPPLAYVPVTIAQAHASYAVMCRADGMMYHDAVCTAARHLGLAVVLHDRGGEVEDAAQKLGASVAEMERFLEAAGETLGPPWRKEHRLAAASAIAVLATHVALSPGG